MEGKAAKEWWIKRHIHKSLKKKKKIPEKYENGWD